MTNAKWKMTNGIVNASLVIRKFLKWGKAGVARIGAIFIIAPSTLRAPRPKCKTHLGEAREWPDSG